MRFDRTENRKSKIVFVQLTMHDEPWCTSTLYCNCVGVQNRDVLHDASDGLTRAAHKSCSLEFFARTTITRHLEYAALHVPCPPAVILPTLFAWRTLHALFSTVQYYWYSSTVQ